MRDKEFDKLILQQGKCCVTGRPLSDCKKLNAVQLTKKATWQYPVWGNFFTGQRNLAIAFVHDDCIVGNVVQGDIINAIEVKDDQIIYHPVAELISANDKVVI